MYQKKRLYLLASGLLGLGLALMSLEVGAQDGLTLERAVSLAYERNPEFSAARSEIGIASGLRRQAGVIPNPELGFEVETLSPTARPAQLQSPSRSSWAASAALESAWRMLIARWWMPISTFDAKDYVQM